MEESLDAYLKLYQEQLNTGTIQKAYQGLMDYLACLRTYLINHYSNDFHFGQLYQGYLDVSYFTLANKALKNKQLKIVILFKHQKCQFEIWLVGQNKQIQQKYWQRLKQANFIKYPLLTDAKEGIISQLLVARPFFDNPEQLTKKIEQSALTFIKEITKAID